MKQFFKKLNLNVFYWALNADVSEPQAEQQEEKKIDFAVGGQAVIEGVMMRSPNTIAIAVRKQNGDIKVKKDPYHTLTQRYRFLNVPILRGIINLFEMMIIGTKAINFSAAASLEEEGEEDLPKKTSNKILEAIMFTLSFIVAIAFSIFLFKFIPLWVTTWLETKYATIADNYIVFNLIDGVLKMFMFLSYIWILTLFKDFRRIFEYHGAEHKSIFNYEKKIPLTVENAKKQTRFHPRCGTSFILIVFVLSIILYTFVPKQPNFWINLLVRLAALPVIAGVSYEYLKLSAKHIDNAIVRAMVQPGLWFQRLTTREPDDSQLEVGLHSLEVALKMEESIVAARLSKLSHGQDPIQA